MVRRNFNGSNITYSATAVATDGTLGVIEGTILVTALIAEVVTDKLNVEIESLGGGRGVGENGQELSGAGVADTQVDGSPVTDGLRAIAPLATLLNGHTLGVDVVLGGGGLALPVEVGVTVGTGQVVGVTGGGGERDGLRLGTGVVSTANGNIVGHLVLDVDTANSRNAELLVLLVGKVELAVLALKATNGLTGGSLGVGPLGLLVTGRASVRAHGTVVALIASDGGHDIAYQIIDESDVLDTGETTKAKVVESDGAVFGGECTTVKLSIGEVSGEAGGTRAAGGAGGAGSSGSRDGAGGAGGLRGAGGAGGGDSRRSLLEDGRSDGGSRGWGRRGCRGGSGGAAASGRAGSGDSTVEPLKLVLGEALASIGDANGLRGAGLGGIQHDEIVDHRAGDRDGFGLSGTLVVMGVSMAVGGRKTSRGQRGDGIGELHSIGGANLWINECVSRAQPM